MYELISAEDIDGFGELLAEDFAEHEETVTHECEFRGMPATGRSVDVQLIDIIRFGDDGLAHEHWGVFDALAGEIVAPWGRHTNERSSDADHLRVPRRQGHRPLACVAEA